MLKHCICFILFFLFSLSGLSAQSVFPFTAQPLTTKEDLSVSMVAGINRFLIMETDRLQLQRGTQWKRDFSNAGAFARSVAGQRALLTSRLGIAENRRVPGMQILTDNQLKQYSTTSNGCRLYAVRWNAIDNLSSEGILITPPGKTTARVVMVPDADMLPEVLTGITQPGTPGFGKALALAKSGVEVLIPALINRDIDFSGNPALNVQTQQPHREWIYRQAYTIGRHVIGYELQKIFAALDWFELRNKTTTGNLPLGVAGYGEGGLLALYATAIDERIASTLVSGYFDNRENLWKEPIYRNVFGLLKTFGDAELAVMAWPRQVIIEAAEGPQIVHQNPGATPGIISSPAQKNTEREFQRAVAMLPADRSTLHLITTATQAKGEIFSNAAIKTFLQPLSIACQPQRLSPVGPIPWVIDCKRQEYLVREMSNKVQQELSVCERTRDKAFWDKINKGDAEQRKVVKEGFRAQFANVLGQLPTPTIPFNARARVYEQSDTWTSYEVTLDVFSPDVFAWGILVVPKNIRPGEKRPVIVCQHGLEGLPSDVVTTDSTAKNYHYYKGFATRLAEKGYITFAPHNPYRGEDNFRVIQRKANPLGLTLFSVIVGQHERIVEWLQQLNCVDASQVAIYGLSYGGKTAMRVPALVKGYALSICSADFNEWVRKVSTTEYSFGYVYTGEYDMPEWDLGHTFNYAEMAALIALRPFMVERGHFDGVGTDEWVNYEYAKVRRYYNLLGLSHLVDIEHFVGPHSINGKGTFEFLDKHLVLPK